ncbi:hypothetical protein CTI12_AA058820 [Artemisia annua]|uniref:DUF1664 domain-containing protein n=1 Tax=Artemisia annua TaxID=35608 RepID=A0A2U1Q1I0_ARTAN|nr:hypothetical protein CTI12_AA058820 [Artemisia annua]
MTSLHSPLRPSSSLEGVRDYRKPKDVMLSHSSFVCRDFRYRDDDNHREIEAIANHKGLLQEMIDEAISNNTNKPLRILSLYRLLEDNLSVATCGWRFAMKRLIMQLLASNQQVTIVTSTKSGFKTSNMMFASKRSLSDAMNVVAKKLDDVYSSHATTKRHLTSRIDRVNSRIDAFAEINESTQEEVSSMRRVAPKTVQQLEIVRHAVLSMETSLERIEGRQQLRARLASTFYSSLDIDEYDIFLYDGAKYGFKTSNMMFASKRSLSDAMNVVAKKLDDVYSSHATTKRYLTSRIDRVNSRIDAFAEINESTQEEASKSSLLQGFYYFTPSRLQCLHYFKAEELPKSSNETNPIKFVLATKPKVKVEVHDVPKVVKQERVKPVRNNVRYAEMYRSQPRDTEELQQQDTKEIAQEEDTEVVDLEAFKDNLDTATSLPIPTQQAIQTQEGTARIIQEDTTSTNSQVITEEESDSLDLEDEVTTSQTSNQDIAFVGVVRDNNEDGDHSHGEATCLTTLEALEMGESDKVPGFGENGWEVRGGQRRI